jgi:hypothetical protein
MAIWLVLSQLFVAFLHLIKRSVPPFPSCCSAPQVTWARLDFVSDADSDYFCRMRDADADSCMLTNPDPISAPRALIRARRTAD